jgi:hypothetical protein
VAGATDGAIAVFHTRFAPRCIRATSPSEMLAQMLGMRGI